LRKSLPEFARAKRARDLLDELFSKEKKASLSSRSRDLIKIHLNVCSTCVRMKSLCKILLKKLCKINFFGHAHYDLGKINLLYQKSYFSTKKCESGNSSFLASPETNVSKKC